MKRQFLKIQLVTLLMVLLCGCGKQETPQAQDVTEVEETATEGKQEEEVAPVEEPGLETEDETASLVDPMELYESFLQGDEKVYTDFYEEIMGENTIFTYADFAGNEGMTMNEFLSACCTTAEDNLGKTVLESAKYAYIDCGFDEVPELALHGEYVDDYGTIYLREFIIKEKEGKLQLTYQSFSSYRTYVGMESSAGKVIANASYGAVTYADEVGYLNADGVYDLCYHTVTSYNSASILDDRFADLSEQYSDLFLRSYYFESELPTASVSIDPERYYCAEFAEGTEHNGVDPGKNLEKARKLFEAAGVELYTDAEINMMIANREIELGITDEIRDAGEVEWNTLEMDLAVINGAKEEDSTEAEGTVITIHPGAPENFMWEGPNICHITDADTGERYSIDGMTVLSDDLPCYTTGETPGAWLSDYLTHDSVMDEDSASEFFLQGFSTLDVWEIEVGDYNIIYKIKGITSAD